MYKKLFSVVMIFAILFSFSSCIEKEVSGETVKESPSGISKNEISETETETENESSTKTEKPYLDAADKDFDDILSILGQLCYRGCWSNGFNNENSDFSNDLSSVYEIIDYYFGSEDYDYQKTYIPNHFVGLIDYIDPYYTKYFNMEYDSLETFYRDNRKIFDPLFMFENYDDSSVNYYSVADKTVEMIEAVVLGGTVKKDGLIKNELTEDCCYHCDGRFYFQIWQHNGRGPEFQETVKKQSDDGKYIISTTINSYGTVATAQATVGLIEEDGGRYWKIFSVDWGATFSE